MGLFLFDLYGASWQAAYLSMTPGHCERDQQAFALRVYPRGRRSEFFCRACVKLIGCSWPIPLMVKR